MGEKAKEQRERIRKGLVGEHIAMDYFDAMKVPYLAIDQNTHTWSQSLASGNLKRPDFVVWDRDGHRALVEVKNYTAHVVSATIRVDHTDVRSLEEHTKALGMAALIALVMEDRYLFFLKLKSLMPPSVLGQPYTIDVVPGLPELPIGARPQWLPPSAVVAWDSVFASGLGLNKLSDPAALFT